MTPRLNLKLAAALYASALLSGCGAFQPAARQGHDLLESPNRSAAIRVPAGIGAIVGHALGAPFSFLLFPSVFFERAAVESCDVLVPVPNASRVDASPPGTQQKKRGDIYIPLALAPIEYGSGLGAAVFGQPFDWIASAFRELPPETPPEFVEETPELPPGEKDPQLSFEVLPPSPSR